MLAALGLGPTGQPVSSDVRDAAVVALKASADSSVATQAELPVDEVAGEIDPTEIPW